MKRFTTAAVFLVLCESAVHAHVTIRPRDTRLGATETYTMRVPTEGKVATTSVELEVPDGVTIVSVNGAPGSFDTKESSDRIVSITWTLEIGRGRAQELTFVARNPSAGVEIAWKVHQRYADGTASDWVEPAGSRRPGPVTKLTAAGQGPAIEDAADAEPQSRRNRTFPPVLRVR
jgi:uncharacterized protein YcnI